MNYDSDTLYYHNGFYHKFIDVINDGERENEHFLANSRYICNKAYKSILSRTHGFDLTI